jgi:hypothetical protein
MPFPAPSAPAFLTDDRPQQPPEVGIFQDTTSHHVPRTGNTISSGITGLTRRMFRCHSQQSTEASAASYDDSPYIITAKRANLRGGRKKYFRDDSGGIEERVIGNRQPAR